MDGCGRAPGAGVRHKMRYGKHYLWACCKILGLRRLRKWERREAEGKDTGTFVVVRKSLRRFGPYGLRSTRFGGASPDK